MAPPILSDESDYQQSDTYINNVPLPGVQYMWQVTVNEEQCKGCNECVDGCPGEVYELLKNKATPVNSEECHGCFTCVELCEEDAITVEDK